MRNDENTCIVHVESIEPPTTRHSHVSCRAMKGHGRTIGKVIECTHKVSRCFALIRVLGVSRVRVCAITRAISEGLQEPAITHVLVMKPRLGTEYGLHQRLNVGDAWTVPFCVVREVVECLLSRERVNGLGRLKRRG